MSDSEAARKVRIPRVCLAVGVIIVLLGAPISAQEPEGAPEAPGDRSLYPLFIPFLNLGPLRPESETGVDITLAYANTFSHSWHAKAIKNEFGTLDQPFSLYEAETLHARFPQDNIFFVDADVTRLSVFASLRLASGFSASLEVPWISFAAIRGDGFIEDFHRTFGLGDTQERLSFPRNRFQIVLQSPNGPLQFVDETPSSGLGDVVATTSWRGETSRGFRFSADLALKLPTGDADQFRGSGSLDGGLLLGTSKNFGSSKRWTLRIEGGVVLPGRYRGAIPLALDPSAFFRLLVAGQVRIWSRTWVSLSAVAEQSPLHQQNLGNVAAASGAISLGLAQHILGLGLLELSVTEHLPSPGDTTDIAATLRFRYDLAR